MLLSLSSIMIRAVFLFAAIQIEHIATVFSYDLTRLESHLPSPSYFKFFSVAFFENEAYCFMRFHIQSRIFTESTSAEFTYRGAKEMALLQYCVCMSEFMCCLYLVRIIVTLSLTSPSNLIQIQNIFCHSHSECKHLIVVFYQINGIVFSILN